MKKYKPYIPTPKPIKIKPKKHFGQNFLNDQRILRKIVETAALTADDHVIEIGPGKGALTQYITMPQSVTIVEKDRDFITLLSSKFSSDKLHVVEADFLDWDFPTDKKYKVLGNIPYNISTPIIEKLIKHRANISKAVLTVQLEFGQRITANPGVKDFGSLTCFVQYYTRPRMVFPIKRTAFYPVPQVDSCCIELNMLDNPSVSPKDEAIFFKVIRTAFTLRRKTIINALQSLIPKEKLLEICQLKGINIMARPETLNLQNYVDIADSI